MRNNAVPLKAPAELSLPLYLLLSNDRSFARGVATTGTAATDCRYLVLQQQILYATAAAAGAVSAEGARGPPVSTEDIDAAR